MLKEILDNEVMEDPVKEIEDQHIQMTVIHNNKLVEIESDKILNINNGLYSDQ